MLTRLGLPSGQIPQAYADSVTSSTTVRDGQYFYVSVDGAEPSKVTIDRDDSFGFLSFKLRKVLGTSGTAEFVNDDIEGRYLKIEALTGHRIEITPGRGSQNALSGLGLSEAILYGEAEEEDTTSAAANPYELGFTDDMNVDTESKASDAFVLIDNAMREIKKAYRFLVGEPEEDIPEPGQASALTRRRLAAYQALFNQGPPGIPTGGSAALTILGQI